VCGIGGVAGGDPATAQAIALRINAAQAKRGPDGAGIWASTEVTLAHTRLAVLDLSAAGAQPMVRPTWALTYNGEIYNHGELRAELRAAGHRFRGTSDTETLLVALERFGLDRTLERINGMFAFAAWHRPSRTLHLVRDRLGIKPLCWYAADQSLVFASNPAAIVAAVDTHWSVDRHAIVRYLHLGAPYGDDTLFAGVSRIPPATVLTWKDGVTSQRQYWTPQPRDEPLDELLTDAVRMRLMSDVPLCILLSGGVDSTLLAKLADRGGVTAVHLDNGKERQYAQRAAEAYGLRFEVVSPDGGTIDTLMTEYVDFTGEPSMAAAIPAMACRALRRHAVVALSANGADELFLGYPRTLSRLQALHIFRARLPLTARYDRLVHLPDEFRFVLAGFASDTGAPAQWFELNTYIRYDLNPVLDYAGMMSSVEVRVPFLDHRVVERALTLKVADKIDRSIGDVEQGRKAPLKRLLGDVRQLWDRKKLGFSMPAGLTQTTRDQAVAAFLKRGVLTTIGGSGPYAARDAIYLRNSAWSLEHWFRRWVDSGRVAA